MIENLVIKNFILIDELKLNFSEGFNVFTGETGAGKSIIINAIDIAFGAKATKDLIKTGKDTATIELSVKFNDKFPVSFLEENGIDLYGNELIISKEITQTSSRSRVNGAMVTQEVIKKLRELLIDIHSQHETYVYIQPKHHIRLLDNFGDEMHKNLLYSYQKTYAEYSEIFKKLEIATNGASSTEQEVEFLKYQINEIEEVKIENPGEDSELSAELEILSNAETLKDLTFSSYWGLYGDDANLIQNLSSIKNNLSKATDYDKNLSQWEEEIVNALEILKEAASALRNYSENISADLEKIDNINARIEMLNKIKRKYGNSLEEVIAQYDKLCAQLNGIEFSKDDIERLEIELQQIKSVLEECAQRLSSSRIKLADELSVLLSNELEKLELPKVKFKVNVENTNDKFSETGKDIVEFFISTNISEPLKPLAKIASGGEISRVMLAIKTIFAKTDNINTVIFDEIDTGVSGSVAQAVSDELVELAKTHQVICITHQPIIAAKAPKYFYVKKSQNDSTEVNVFDLDEENKIKALAIMASGDINAEAMNFARQLVKG